MASDEVGAPGFYLVIADSRFPASRRGRPRRLFGPFVVRHQAEMLRTTAHWLGLAEPPEGVAGAKPKGGPRRLRSAMVIRRSAPEADPPARSASLSSD